MSEIEMIRIEAEKLLEAGGIELSAGERSALSANDFGLGNLRSEGFVFVDLLRTPRIRVTLFVLLPHQTLPEHFHPAYDGHPGKEETLRVLHGETRIYVPGDVNNPRLLVPKGKDRFYTARHEIVLHPGEAYTLEPPIPHWFQGGPEGSVNMTFQDRVDETRNVFTDPQSTGCPIRLED